jgi:transposase
LKVSLSTVAKNIKSYDENGSHEDLHRKGRPTHFIYLPASEIAAQINDLQSSIKRHNSTSTVQRRLRQEA